jgi:hypothetical protein
MGRSDLHDSGGHPDHRLDGAISDEVRRWLRVDEVGRITRAKGVTSTSAIPVHRHQAESWVGSWATRRG